MERQEEIVKAIVESDAKFRAQFDPNSEDHHKGDPRPVPLGGARIPEGLTEAPPVPLEEQKVPDDPRYAKVMEARSFLQEFKKTVSQVCPAVEARLRAKGHKDEAAREHQIAEADRKIQEILQIIQNSRGKLEEHKEVIGDYTEDLNFILMNSASNYENKEEYGEFMLKVSMFNKKIFKDIQTLLQVIKDIKKGKV